MTPEREVSWWKRSRWWQNRRSLEIMREQVHRVSALAQCQQDDHDWDEHHPFANHGRRAVVCLWCGSVYVDIGPGSWAIIAPNSEVYPTADVERIRLEREQ